jgi:hypothetical protein
MTQPLGVRRTLPPRQPGVSVLVVGSIIGVSQGEGDADARMMAKALLYQREGCCNADRQNNNAVP